MDLESGWRIKRKNLWLMDFKTEKYFVVEIWESCACVSKAKYKPINVLYSIINKRIRFREFNYVVQLRFYELLFPVSKFKCYNSSKIFSTFGKKAKLFCCRALQKSTETFQELKDQDIYNFGKQDFLFLWHSQLSLYHFEPDEIMFLGRFVLFEQKSMDLINSNLSLNDAKILCNQNVLSICMKNNSSMPLTAENRTPKLKYFSGELGNGWEKMLLEWDLENDSFVNTQLKECEIIVDSISDVKSLHEFVHRRKYLNKVYIISNQDVPMEEVLKYFKKGKSSPRIIITTSEGTTYNLTMI